MKVQAYTFDWANQKLSFNILGDQNHDRIELA